MILAGTYLKPRRLLGILLERHWNSLKRPWNPLEHSGTYLKILRPPDTHWNACETTWNTLKSLDTSWNEIVLKAAETSGLLWIFPESSLNLTWTALKSPGTPEMPLKLLSTPSNVPETLWNPLELKPLETLETPVKLPGRTLKHGDTFLNTPKLSETTLKSPEDYVTPLKLPWTPSIPHQTLWTPLKSPGTLLKSLDTVWNA